MLSGLTPMRRRATVVAILLACHVLAAQAPSRFPKPADAGEESISSDDLKRHVEFLASDEMKGRRTGSEEEQRAGEYIVAHFESCGLKPAGEGKGWTQKFRAIAFTGTNLAGALRGSSQPKSAEYVVVGAHYDHVGLGTFGSRTRASGQIHNGADDNASGTSGLLELVEAFSKKPCRRSILFMAFSGEEMGLVGSRAWCEKPTKPIAKVVAMVNLDMIGRCKDDYLYVGGVGTAKGLPELVRGTADPFPFRIEMGPGGTGPSDFEPFYKKDVPVLFFFTGLHAEYHAPEDDVHLINTADQAGVVRLAYRVIRRLADDDKRPTFRKDDRRAMPESELEAHEKQGPRLGIRIGDWTGDGAPVTEVAPESPAAQAGIGSGDVVTSVDGIEPKHHFDLLGIIGMIPEKGQVKIALRRDGKKLTKTVTVK
jgi:hypothetical protein